MYPILGCSIFSLAIFLERLFYILKGKKGVLLDFQRRVDELLNNPNLEVKGLKDAIDMLIEGKTVSLSRGIGALSLIARVSTLLGLLGTVLGMVEVFRNVAAGKLGNPEALAGGIWVALLTTVFGLSVAIPTVFMHGLLSSMISRIEEEMLKLGEEVLIRYVKGKA